MIMLKTHPNYSRLIEIAHRSHEQDRSAADISDEDIARARLYSYAFRCHVIGAFHATQQALGQLEIRDTLANAHQQRADQLLADLANRAMDPVGMDARALISTFHYYATHIEHIVEALNKTYDACGLDAMRQIRDGFVARMEEITTCSGIHLTKDTYAPEQASFIVPNLGITIVPLVYGDFHSWNLAYLDAAPYDVPFHLHQEGVEIHLGYGPVHGYTVLGECYAEVDEGYAMPIPPKTRHGYVNNSTMVHHVPFIFGSLKLGGWGVFLDVEPQPISLSQLEQVSARGTKMNGTILLEREIEEAAAKVQSVRYPIIPVSLTDRNGVGGLELSVARINKYGLTLKLDRFCMVSVVRGQGTVHMAGIEQPIDGRDHFGVPAGISCFLRQEGDEPLVMLDAVIK